MQNSSDSSLLFLFSHHLCFRRIRTSHSSITFSLIFPSFEHISFGSIGLSALQENTPTPAPTSTTVQRFLERICVKRIAVFGLSNLSAPGCYNILGKICLPFICSYCGKYVQVFPQWALRPCHQLLFPKKIQSVGLLYNVPFCLQNI